MVAVVRAWWWMVVGGWMVLGGMGRYWVVLRVILGDIGWQCVWLRVVLVAVLEIGSGCVVIVVLMVRVVGDVLVQWLLYVVVWWSGW